MAVLWLYATRSSPSYRGWGLNVTKAVNMRGSFALEPAMHKRATKEESVSFRAPLREA